MLLTTLPFNFLFLSITIFGSILTLSSSHWLSMWAGLEINLMGFIPLLMFQSISSEAESGVKYFIFQAIGSSLLMLGSMLGFYMSSTWEIMSITNFSSIYLILMGLILKLGIFPFHFWVPVIMAGLSWFSCMVLATWQKLAPLFLLMMFSQMWMNSTIFLILTIMGMMSSLVGGVGGINQSQLRAIIAYSSIAHMGWMLFAMLLNENLLKFYFLVYITISLGMFMILWQMNYNTIPQTMKLTWNLFYSLQPLIIMLLLSLGGLPPLLGFTSKLLVIFYTSKLMSPFLILPLILGSLLSLYYYLSLLFSLTLSSSFSISPMKISSLHMMSNSSFIFNTSLMKMTSIINILGGLLMLLTIPFIEFM